MIVFSIAVFVIDLGERIGICNKNARYKPMNVFVCFLSVFCQLYTKVAAAMVKRPDFLRRHRSNLLPKSPLAAFGTYPPIPARFVIGEHAYRLPHGEPSTTALSMIQP